MVESEDDFKIRTMTPGEFAHFKSDILEGIEKNPLAVKVYSSMRERYVKENRGYRIGDLAKELEIEPRKVAVIIGTLGMARILELYPEYIEGKTVPHYRFNVKSGLLSKIDKIMGYYPNELFL